MRSVSASPARPLTLVVLEHNHVGVKEIDKLLDLLETLRFFLGQRALFTPQSMSDRGPRIRRSQKPLVEGKTASTSSALDCLRIIADRRALPLGRDCVQGRELLTKPRTVSRWAFSRPVSRRARSITIFSTSAKMPGRTNGRGPKTTWHASAVSRFGCRARRSKRDIFVPLWHPRRKAISSCVRPLVWCPEIAHNSGRHKMQPAGETQTVPSSLEKMCCRKRRQNLPMWQVLFYNGLSANELFMKRS